MISLLQTWWHTLRHLKFIQIYGRIWFYLYRPRPDTRLRPELRTLAADKWLTQRLRHCFMLDGDTCCFLNECRTIESSEIWNDPNASRLWLYNLHYFDDLNSQDAGARKNWHQALIQRWIDENPPVEGTGWEPYPTSLRIVNWIKWALAGNLPESACLRSLAVQARFLARRLEWHLLGNHLLSNAKALAFVGLFFEGVEADRWLEKAEKLLLRELNEQILADGGHLERSPMYHLIVLEDLLDLVNIYRAYGRKVPDSVTGSIPCMLDWAQMMMHPDGDIPFFNDSAFGIAPCPGQLLEYAALLGLKIGEVYKGTRWLRNSGYLKLVCGDAVLFFDIAQVGPDHLPGHAHADTLSLELSLFHNRFFVNSGTSLYETGDERLRQRGTGAHNTVTVDGENSSEVWGSFRVARRARVSDIKVNPGAGNAAASHNGYKRLHGRITHRREVVLGDASLLVEDVISGSGEHYIEVIWHLHPDVICHIDENPGSSIELEFHKNHFAGLTFDGVDKYYIEESSWHPEFGKSIPNSRIVATVKANLPVKVTTSLKWH